MLRTRAPVAAKVLLPRAAPRLACVKPIASVHPEPGSNSPLLLQFCFVFLLAPWDDVLFDTYSLSLRISLLICLNDGILVYHLFFFRSFYVLHNCSLLFHISLFKAFQRSLHLPRALPLSFPSCEGSLVPQRFRPFGCPFLWGRDCKGSNLFSSDQIRRKKSPVTETDSSSFASFATCAPPRLAEPLFLSCDCKGNNLFSSDQIFWENYSLSPKILPSLPLSPADLLQI